MPKVFVEWWIGGDERTFRLEDKTTIVFSSYPDSRNCDRDMLRAMCTKYGWSPDDQPWTRVNTPNYPYSAGRSQEYTLEVTSEQERMLRLTLHPERMVVHGVSDDKGDWLIYPRWETDPEWLARWPFETRALLKPGEMVCSTVAHDELIWL